MRTFRLFLVAAALTGCATGKVYKKSYELRCDNGAWVYIRVLGDNEQRCRELEKVASVCECVAEEVEVEDSVYRK